MKVLGIFIVIFSLTVALSFSIDLLLGFKLSHAFFHLLNPFWVIETGEYVMLLFFLFLTIGQQIIMILKNKANKQNGSS